MVDPPLYSGSIGEKNILSGQLEYAPVLKNAQATYTAHAGIFFVVFFNLLHPTAYND